MREDTVTLAYFGTSAFEITTSGGKRILLDPYIRQNPLCQQNIEYFYDTDLILVTHGAFDHLGDTLEIMKKGKAILVSGPDVARYAVRNGISKGRIIATIYGDQRELMGIKIKSVEAKHMSRLDSDTETYYGVPLGFVVSAENDIRIYHAGDTSLFSDLRLIGMLYKPNIMLVGVANVSEGYPIEMNPTEAALATLWVTPDIVIPMHYPADSEEPLKFLEAVKIIAPNVEPVLLKPNNQITYRKHRLVVD
jgi:L-ascorbate metabolism protein UlaG (beta-lactamase superfamily)